MGRETLQRPDEISLIIGGEPKFCARPHHPGQPVQRLKGNKASLVVPFFWPGIGEKNKNPVKTRVGKRIDDVTRIALINSYILELLRGESGQQLCHAGNVRLNSHHSVFRIGGSLRREMLPGAEAYFQPHVTDGAWREIRSRIYA